MITPKQRRLLAGAASTVGVALAIGGLWYLWRFVQDLAWAELWTSLTAWQIGAVFLLVPVMALGNTWLASSWPCSPPSRSRCQMAAFAQNNTPGSAPYRPQVASLASHAQSATQTKSWDS